MHPGMKYQLYNDWPEGVNSDLPEPLAERVWTTICGLKLQQKMMRNDRMATPQGLTLQQFVASQLISVI